MTKNKGLGRGLEALFDSSGVMLESYPKASGIPATLRIEQLVAGKYQPRTKMDDAALAELAESIRSQGLIQPIIVRKISGEGIDKVYEIIAGERRFRACKLAGFKEVPVVVKEASDKETAAMALIENIQREDLNPLEEAKGVQQLIKEFEFTHEQAALAVGRSRSGVTNMLRLLQLDPEVQEMLMAQTIDMGHARALLGASKENQPVLATMVIAQGLSVRETERLVAKSLEEKKVPAAAKPAIVPPKNIERITKTLSERLGSNVTVKLKSGNTGQLVINFSDLAALETLHQQLRLQ